MQRLRGDQRTDDLLGEERVAFHLLEDQRLEPAARLAGPEQVVDQSRAHGRREGRVLDLCVTTLIAATGNGAETRGGTLPLGAPNAAEQQRDGVDQGNQVFDQLRGRLIGPVEVFEGQDNRPLAGEPFNESAHTAEDLPPHCLAVEVLHPKLEFGWDRKRQ